MYLSPWLIWTTFNQGWMSLLQSLPNGEDEAIFFETRTSNKEWFMLPQPWTLLIIYYYNHSHANNRQIRLLQCRPQVQRSQRRQGFESTHLSCLRSSGYPLHPSRLWSAVRGGHPWLSITKKTNFAVDSRGSPSAHRCPQEVWSR